MKCKNCGEDMSGDGITTALHCPDTEASDREPDADPLHCGKRYRVVPGSLSAHCCYEATVVDTKRPFFIGDVRVMYQGEPAFCTVCECFSEETAQQVCAALNAHSGERGNWKQLTDDLKQVIESDQLLLSAARQEADELRAEVEALRAVQTRLLIALEVLVENGGIGPEQMFRDARAAIDAAKASGA